jgi:predicted MFS family arabinose efflux permease
MVLISVAAAICSVGIVTVLAAQSPAGAATTMVLNGSAVNLGSAGGAALSGLLIALGGYRLMAIGLPLFALTAAALAWWPARVGVGTRQSLTGN